MTSSSVTRWLTQPSHGHNEELTVATLTCLHGLCSHGRALEKASEDELRAISTQLALLLRGASKMTVIAPASISLFSSASKKQVGGREGGASLAQCVRERGIILGGENFSCKSVRNLFLFSLTRLCL